MIPAVRMLWLFGTILFPLAVVAGIAPALRPWGLAIGVGLAALALVDALLSRSMLTTVRASAPRARMYKDRPATMNLEIAAGHGFERLRVAIPWPAGLESELSEQAINMRTSPAAVKLVWPVTPRRRGDYRIDRLYCAAPSRLGLWELHRAVPLGWDAQVFPSLQSTDELLAIRSNTSGEHARRQLGRGREFDHLREYVAGDGFDEIDWKATARRGKPITRVFQVERTQDVYAVIDASRLTGRPVSAFEPRLERYVQAALVLGVIADKQGDRFGLATFTDRVHDLVRSGRGVAHSALCRQALYRLHPSALPADFDDVGSQLRTRLHGRALLLFFTDLDDPAAAEGFTRAAALLARQHLVAAITLRPEGVEPLFTRAAEDEDHVYRQIGGHMRWKRLIETQGKLQSLGVEFRLAQPESLSRATAGFYDEIKQRQLL